MDPRPLTDDLGVAKAREQSLAAEDGSPVNGLPPSLLGRHRRGWEGTGGRNVFMLWRQSYWPGMDLTEPESGKTRAD